MISVTLHFRYRFVLALVAGSLLGSPAIAAEECNTLKQINSIDLMTNDAHTRMLVPVSINGSQKLLLLDTGGSYTQISHNVAQDLKLPIAQSPVEMLDLYGHASDQMAVIENFGLGRMKGSNLHLAIAPDPNFGSGTRYVGVLSPDVMSSFDVDMDFGNLKLNFFSPDHCEGRVNYWGANVLAIVPMQFLSRHVQISVTLDGHDVRAVIDTGAPRTTIKAELAKRVFNLSEDSPDSVALAGEDGKKVFGHVFSSLAFEGVSITNPHIVVLPDIVGDKDPNNGYQTGSLVKRSDDLDDAPEMIIGMDVLQKLHVYIAFKERKLYISAATFSSRP